MDSFGVAIIYKNTMNKLITMHVVPLGDDHMWKWKKQQLAYRLFQEQMERQNRLWPTSLDAKPLLNPQAAQK